MRLINWHKGILEKVVKKTGLSYYAIAWIAFIKGIITGLAI